MVTAATYAATLTFAAVAVLVTVRHIRHRADARPRWAAFTDFFWGDR